MATDQTLRTATAPADDLRWAPPALLGLVMALTVAVLFAATLALPHDPYIRFQQLTGTIQFRSLWAYERIEYDPRPIDVAIIGNSRLEAGVSGPLLQAALRKATGSRVTVANLALPQEGRNLHYAIVKRLIERRPELKLIVLSAIEQMPREGHPAFRDLADWPDVLRAPMLVNIDYANDAAVLPYRQMSLFAQSRYPAAFGRRTTFDPAAYAAEVADGSRTYFLPDGRKVDRDSIRDPDELGESAHSFVAKVKPPLLPASLADAEFAVERRYTREIADLARAHGVSIIFLQLPVYQDRRPVREQAFYRAIGAILRPGFIDGDPRLYSDYGHLNVNGSARVAPWLAAELLAMQRAGAIRRFTGERGQND